jgi:hypothetical protein
MRDIDIDLSADSANLRIASATQHCNNVRQPSSLARWSPSRRPARHVVHRVPSSLQNADQLDGAKDPADWTLLNISAAENLGHVRCGMTYNKDYGTSAGFFEKSCRLQFLEGPNEPALADHFEMSPKYLDFQFQPLDMTFRRADGKIIHKYPDVAIEFDDNTVRFGEIKSNLAWFNAPSVRRPLDRIDIALRTSGLDSLLRIPGEPFRQDRVIEAHQLAMDSRLTAYDVEGDVHTARSAILASGGRSSFGNVIAALGGSRCNAEDKLYAMLLRRVVAFDLFTPPTSDTSVTLPRPAKPYALREILNRFKRKAA